MLNENAVVGNISAYLGKNGYKILKTCSTMEKGYDICAERNGKILYVEAKGQTSSKKSPRFGKEFSYSQKKTHIAMAIFKTLSTLNEKKAGEFAIALPFDDGHAELIRKVLPSLIKMKIKVFLVEESGDIVEIQKNGLLV